MQRDKFILHQNKKSLPINYPDILPLEMSVYIYVEMYQGQGKQQRIVQSTSKLTFKTRVTWDIPLLSICFTIQVQVQSKIFSFTILGVETRIVIYKITIND